MGKSRKRIERGRRVQAEYQARLKGLNIQTEDQPPVPEPMNITVNAPKDTTPSLPILWDQNTSTNKSYVRKLTEARETISRRNSAFKKAAVGSQSLNSFFKPVPRPAEAPPVPEPEPPIRKPRKPDEETIEKMKNARILLRDRVRINSDLNSEQHKEGVTQYLKYVIVDKTLELLINEGKSYVEAIKLIVDRFWCDPSKYYRYRVARLWLDTFVDTGSIPLHQQGKHPKRGPNFRNSANNEICSD